MTAILIAVLLSIGETELPEPAESIHSDTLIVTGTFAGYSLGDYYHAVFLLENGEMVTFWAPGRNRPGLDVFMFLHRWELMDVKVINILTFLHETGRDELLPTVIDANAGGENWREWCDRISEELGVNTVEEFYDYFGDPSVEEELFNEWEYANGSDD